MTVLKLIQMPPGRIVAGSILWQGRDLVKLPADAMRKIRSKEIAIIFQEPMTSLNPVYTVGQQIAETLRLHEGLNRRDAMDRAVEMLRLVRIPTPERRVRDYPHQFSGGMRQRVMIAMALSCNPKLLIADEPTTALDVTIQAQILDLLREMKSRLGMAIMLITHAMGVVAETAAAGGGDVCRTGGRGGLGRGAVRPAAASLHAGPDPLDPAHRHDRGEEGAAGGDRRRGAEPDRPAAGLPVRAALQAGDGGLHRSRAGAARDRGRPQGRLHPVLRWERPRDERATAARQRAGEELPG